MKAERAQHDWVRCLRCRHIWDDLNPEHEVCACIDTFGSRTVEQLDTYTLPFVANASDSTRPPGADRGDGRAG